MTSDRVFAKSVGVALDPCEMCDLLRIEADRYRKVITAQCHEIAVRDRLIQRQRYVISTWKLASFSAALMMVLFAWASLRHTGG